MKSKLLILLVLSSIFANAQPTTVIHLKNPSFEPNDYAPLFGEDVKSWIDCGFAVEEPPTIQPGFHEVQLKPQHQKGYLSMVVRDNNTWDAVGQELVQPLAAGKCYKFKLYLANAERYLANSRTTGSRVNYRNPLRLLIWGGKSYCEARHLLGKTDLIKNNEWEPYEFILQPKEAVTHLVLHAYYLNPMSLAYNGNILIDNASDLTECACEAALPVEEESLVELKPKSLEELENFIRLHGQNIVFKEGSSELLLAEDEDLFDAKNWSQVYLAVIGKSLKYFPAQQLVIAIKSSSKRQLERRNQFLQNFFAERGVDKSAYRCIDLPVKSNDAKWLAINKYLAFRLESRLKENN